jgi:hypothetical protein
MRVAKKLLFAATFLAWTTGTAMAAPDLSAVQMSGFVDVYYSHNFNDPDSQLNTGSNFDFHDSAFSLSLAEIVFQKPASPVGFRLDLNFGDTADWVHCAALSCNSTLSPEEKYRNVQQAYITWSDQNLTLDVGKMVTHLGAEVIESKDNWNYTRGLLFAWAIPYYHSGARLKFAVSDHLALTGFVYNGWNNVTENSEQKVYGAQIALTPSSSVPILLNWLGPEDGLGGTDRDVYEAIITFNVNDNVALMADYNYGRQDSVAGDAQSYSGVALYGRWKKDPCAFALRYEHTDDDDNLMYGTGTSPKVQEVTATAEHVVGKDLLVRLEYRYDRSDEEIFEDEGLKAADTQSRVTAGLVYSF